MVLDAVVTPPRLVPGSRLGHFDVIELIGAGGMGEVYRARDTRLGRIVAVKVLSADLAGHRDGRERFEREARLASQLTHPHVCTLHDVGTTSVGGGDVQFLVMELVEGETLAARLQRGALPIEQAMTAGIEILGALAAAHAAGIVHRDLKPANVMLTKTGVKLLDFGLARLRPSATGAFPETRSNPISVAGAIAGTLPYLSPEQLRGREADARSDLFALGAVLYEMLTGTRPFVADSQAGLIAAILEHDPPPLTVRQPLIPPALERIVATCLAKDPDDRWPRARDVLRELTWARDGSTTVRTPAAATRRAWRIPAWVTAAAVGLVVGLAVALGGFWRTAPPGLPISFSIYAPDGTKFPRGTAEMAVAPDGRRMVFVAIATDGNRRLFLRQFDAVSARALDGTEGAQQPFWSPDGHSIGFFAGGKVKRIAEAGGAAQVLCDVQYPLGGAWSADGTILFGGGSSSILRVVESGGPVTPVTVLDTARNERGHGFPVFIADTRRFLYLARSNDRERNGIYQASLDDRRIHRVLAGDSNAAAAGRQLLWFGTGSLMAQQYDPSRPQLVGEPITVADHIALDSPLRSGGAFAVADRVLAYRSASPDSRLIWFDRSGKEIGDFPTRADYHNPWLSPDEKRLAVEKTDAVTGRHTIWILDLVRGVTSRLIYDPAGAHGPAWSPDETRVAFSSNRLGGIDLFWVRADGASEHAPLLSMSNRAGFVLNDWSLDGRLLLFQAGPRQNDLWTLPVSPGAKARPFLETAATERHGQFSPDVKWVAYSSDETGVPEVYVRRFPEGEGKWQISSHGGAQPRWRRDGKELFYLAPDGRLMAADVTTGAATFAAGEPHALFTTGITTSIVDRTSNYVVTRDGQRFLVNLGAEDENSAPITVMVNWQATLPK